MKRTVLPVLLVSLWLFSSCRKSIEEDANQMGQLVCNMFTLIDRTFEEGDSTIINLEKIELEANELKKVHQLKYPVSSTDGKKYQRLLEEKIRKCSN